MFEHYLLYVDPRTPLCDHVPLIIIHRAQHYSACPVLAVQRALGPACHYLHLIHGQRGSLIALPLLISGCHLHALVDRGMRRVHLP